MKKTLITIIWLALNITVLYSQQISFSFTGYHSCEYIELDSILIENTTRICDTTLYYPDTVLTIVSTGLDVDRADNDAFHVFQNFPNPFEYETDFYIIVPEKEDYTITIFDLSGKQIIQYNTVLEMGCHNFSFYAGNSGTYVLSIFSMQNQQNIKMEQLGVTHNNTPILKYNGLKTINRNNHEGIKQNSIKSNFEYSIGDELKFKGYATGEFDEIIDTPSESSFYLFNIANEIPNSPLEGMTISEEEQIVWNWNIVPNALGY
jgi:hypothetical protein